MQLLLVGFAFNQLVLGDLFAADGRLVAIDERSAAFEPDDAADGPDLEDVFGAVFATSTEPLSSTASVKFPLPSLHRISGITTLMPRETGPPFTFN